MTTITEADVGWAASQGQATPLTPHHPPVLHSMRELLYTQGYPPSMTRSKMTTYTIALFSCCRSLLQRLIPKAVPTGAEGAQGAEAGQK